MSLPPFLTRVQNAAGPLLGGLSESALGERLRDTSLVLEIDTDAAEDPGHRAGYLLATNLAARLYPRLGLDATDELTAAARKLALIGQSRLCLRSAARARLGPLLARRRAERRPSHRLGRELERHH